MGSDNMVVADPTPRASPILSLKRKIQKNKGWYKSDGNSFFTAAQRLSCGVSG